MAQNLAPANFTRRGALALGALALGTAGIAATAVPASPALADSTAALKDLAAAKGMRFGTAVAVRGDQVETAAIRDVIVRECSIVVPENELKMYVTHNNNATDYNFGPGDLILKFAQDNGIAMRGHNMFWARDEFTPKWLKDYVFSDKAEAEALLRAYIARVAGHYGDNLTSWDVVNETIDPGTGEVRSNVFTRVLGMDSLRICFEAAREHLPHTQLVYNDYMEWDQGGAPHRDGVLKLLHWMRDQNLPVDALGIQGHLGTDHDLTTGDPVAWKAFLDEVSGMGFDMLVTEFDVNDRYAEGDIAARDALVASTATTFLDLTLSYRQVKDVLCWGIYDPTNWLQGFTPRADKQPLRPTPFDADLKPKPLSAAIAEAFKNAPAR